MAVAGAAATAEEDNAHSKNIESDHEEKDKKYSIDTHTITDSLPGSGPDYLRRTANEREKL